jgi:hypothetical protein
MRRGFSTTRSAISTACPDNNGVRRGAVAGMMGSTRADTRSAPTNGRSYQPGEVPIRDIRPWDLVGAIQPAIAKHLMDHVRSTPSELSIGGRGPFMIARWAEGRATCQRMLGIPDARGWKPCTAHGEMSDGPGYRPYEMVDTVTRMAQCGIGGFLTWRLVRRRYFPDDSDEASMPRCRIDRPRQGAVGLPAWRSSSRHRTFCAGTR